MALPCFNATIRLLPPAEIGFPLSSNSTAPVTFPCFPATEIVAVTF